MIILIPLKFIAIVIVLMLIVAIADLLSVLGIVCLTSYYVYSWFIEPNTGVIETITTDRSTFIEHTCGMLITNFILIVVFFVSRNNKRKNQQTN